MNKQAKINRAHLVQTFKGLDRDIYSGLSSSVQDEIYKLVFKELSLLTESGAIGGSEQLENYLIPIVSGEKELTKAGIVEISALVEYGKSFDELNEREKQTANNMEIQQEFSHFSRIMGLDFIISQDFNLAKPERAFVYCKDFARFIHLLHERRVERGLEAQFVNDYYGAEVEANIRLSFTVGQLTKNKTMNLSAMVSGPARGSKEDEIKLILLTYERFLCRFPYQLANLLIDLFVYLLGLDSIYKFRALKEFKDGNQRYAYEWQIGDGCFLYTSPKTGNYYEKITSLIANKSEGFLGKPMGNRHLRMVRALDGEDNVFILTSSQGDLLIEGKDVSVETLINSKDSHGKVFPANNLRDFFKKKGCQSSVTGLRLKKAVVPKKVVWENVLIEENEIWNLLAASDRVVVEAAHVHADQKKANYVQRVSSMLGNKLVRKFKSQSYLGELRKVIMIDEYHVVNRLDYHEYLSLAADSGFVADEIIFESSPLIKLLSYAILNKIVNNNNSGNKTSFHGDNFYLEITGDGKNGIIELIQGVSVNFTIGCILFDAALTVYKAHFDICNQIYTDTLDRKRRDLLGGRTLHQYMLEKYLEYDDYVSRKEALADFDPGRVEFEKLISIDFDSPFKEIIRSPFANWKAVNVLESFYSSQQIKLNYLLEDLGFPKVSRLVFDPTNGDVSLEE